ncbi:hypothetical protein JCM8097_003212 [Rhodosporidiobolus ruineniae]
MATLGSPPEGANPYAYYLTVLSSLSPSPPDAHGFRTRLIVLLVLVGFYFAVSAVNLGLYVWAHVKGEKKMWIVRMVHRKGGKHFVGNHIVLNALFGAVTAPIYLTQVAFVWSAFLGDGSGLKKMLIAEVAVMPSAYVFGWSISFASFSAYTAVQGGIGHSRWAIPPWLENAIAIVGFLASTATFATLAALTGHAYEQQMNGISDAGGAARAGGGNVGWRGAFGGGGAAVAREVRGHLGPYRQVLPVRPLFLFPYLPNLTKGRPRSIATKLLLACVPLAGLLLAVNLYMLFFCYSIRRHIALFGLSSATRSSEGTGARGQPVGSIPLHPQGISQVGEVESYRDPWASPPLDAPASAIQFVDYSQAAPATGKKVKMPTVKTEVRQANLKAAEQELFIMSISIGFIALGVTSWGAYFFSRVRGDGYLSLTWSEDEAFFLFPAWLFCAALVPSEAYHLIKELRRIRLSRASNPSSSRSIGSLHLPLPSARTRPLPGGGGGGGVSVQVHTTHEVDVVELEEFERRVAGMRKEGEEKGAVGEWESVEE